MARYRIIVVSLVWNFSQNNRQLVQNLQINDVSNYVQLLFLITKCNTKNEALFYIEKTIENEWSRNVLLNMLETNLYSTQGNLKLCNTTTPAQRELARQVLKYPYNNDFLSMREGYSERELEDSLTLNIAKFSLELGSGFAYIGR